MKYDHFSLLPIQAFQPRCGRFGMTLESGAVDFFEDVVGGVGDVIEGGVDIVGDVLSGAGDVVEGVVETVSDIGSDIDDFVNDAIPGGWGTVAAVTLAVATGVPVDFGASAAGAAEAAGALGAAETAGALGAAEAAGALGAAEAAGALGAAEAAAGIEGLAGFAEAADMVGGALSGSYIPGIEGFGADLINEVYQGTGGFPGAEIIDRSIPFDPAAYEQFGGVRGAITGLGDLASAGMQTLTQNPLQTLRVANTANNLYNALTYEPPTRMGGMPTRFLGSSLLSPLGQGTPVGGGLPESLEANVLAAAPVTSTPPSPMNLLQLRQLYPQLSTVDPRLLQMLTNKTTSSPGYYTYGMGSGETPTTTDRTAFSLNPTGGLPTAGFPTIAADRTTRTRTPGEIPNYMSGSPLMEQGLNMLSGRSVYGFAKGGQAHTPEFITGATGHYVQGRGDGQSDDIPAMLADGEYVFDADTVAALGNGSSKAGAAILDKMRENIRKHKRSASHKEIPPKAKSPLAYMKG